MYPTIVILLFLMHFSVGKVFTPCEFATELRRLNVSETEVPDFVCMAKSDTDIGINTRRIVVTNKHNMELGIFKLSTYYFCQDSRNYVNACNLDCEKLVDDDIEDDLQCARIAMSFNNQDFSTWFSWVLNCKGKDVKQQISHCSP